MWKILLLVLAGAALMGLLIAGCKTSRAGYETAPYRAVRAAGGFEVRDYPPLLVVETSVSSDGADGGFGRLFRFITGGNEAKQKIAMTTPVFIQPAETNATMAFVMPARMKRADVPQPNDAAVTVRELAAERFAVWRFQGSRSRGNEDQAVRRLRERMQKEGLEAVGDAVFAYFDPPWTPPFLRRNEVMLRVKRVNPDQSGFSHSSSPAGIGGGAIRPADQETTP